MKRILIYIYAYYPFANANTNVIQPFVDELKKVYQVDILTIRYQDTAKASEFFDGVNIFRYKKQCFPINILTAAGEGNIQRMRSLYKQIVFIPLHYIGKRFCPYERSSEYVALETLVNKNEYDLIITTCESFSSIKAALRLKQNSRVFPAWISYFMDPHAYYIGNHDRFYDMIEDEKQVYEKSDLVITTREIFQENQNNLLSAYIDKTVPMEFPNLRLSQPLKTISLSRNVNCVYAGSLIDTTVRNPEYFYKMLQLLTVDFHFYFVCKRLNTVNRKLFIKYFRGKKNVDLIKDLNLSESLCYIHSADILINFGNRTVNQVPSKIFDYISSGKPIVNIHALHNDTAKFYLQKYEYKLNIEENDALMTENTTRFTEFCLENRGKEMSREQITDRYHEYMSETAAARFVEQVNKVML